MFRNNLLLKRSAERTYTTRSCSAWLKCLVKELYLMSEVLFRMPKPSTQHSIKLLSEVSNHGINRISSTILHGY